MRVLHVYRTYFPDPPGGLQEAIRQISLATKERGVDVNIFTLSPTPNPVKINRSEGVVFRSRSWGAPASCDIGGVSAVKQFSQLASQADIIHYHFPWPFADLLHLLVHPQTPAIMTYHSDIIRQRFLKKMYRPIMERMFNSMSAIVATSPTYANTSPILSDAKFSSKVKTVPLGISRVSCSEIPDMRVFERLSISAENPYFLFVGVLRQYKGLHYLIQAAKNVDAPVIIAGTGPESDELHRLTKELGVKNVIFTGQVSNEEKQALLQKCTALVLPSHLRSEAFGMVLVEAAMNGKPMISCEVGSGTSYVNLDGITGRVVPAEDVNKFAAAMTQLLTNPDEAKQYGQIARNRYEELFSGHALGHSYLSIYREILDNR